MKKKEIKWLTLLFALTGFLLLLSYHSAADQSSAEKRQSYDETDLQNQVLDIQEKNYELEDEQQSLRAEVRKAEKEMADREISSFNLVEDLERLRMITGKVPVEGPGIEVSLNDQTYSPDGENPNQYIVHEGHIQEVVDELILAGAEAITINGYRLSKSSYIQCIGPVITVDGNTSAAPFVIGAIGEPDKFEAALQLNGGVQDKLVNENIEVRSEKKNHIEMPVAGGESS